jgi:pyruvate formate-lyase activating enzyme-like uncharacterized protein
MNIQNININELEVSKLKNYFNYAYNKESYKKKKNSKKSSKHRILRIYKD